MSVFDVLDLYALEEIHVKAYAFHYCHEAVFEGMV